MSLLYPFDLPCQLKNWLRVQNDVIVCACGADCGALRKLLGPGETPELLFEEVLVPAAAEQGSLQTWLSLHAVACSDCERKRRAFALLPHAHLVAQLEFERQTQNV